MKNTLKPIVAIFAVAGIIGAGIIAVKIHEIQEATVSTISGNADYRIKNGKTLEYCRALAHDALQDLSIRKQRLTELENSSNLIGSVRNYFRYGLLPRGEAVQLEREKITQAQSTIRCCKAAYAHFKTADHATTIAKN